MTQKVLTSLLLLLICGSVAAEPTHKQTTTASRRAAKTQHNNTTSKEPSAEETPVKEPPAKEPPANELFGAAPGPAPLAARAIGSYARGCLAGAVALPINGPDWQVMRLSRNRNWGHPRLLDFLERFAADAHNLDGWPGLLVGDMSQPRGGPMVNGHSSHQIGLDVDIWLTPMPDRILTPEERENIMAVSMLKDPFTVDPDKWTPLHTKLIKRAASYPEVDRIFVHPAIKKVLCEQAGDDRAWLAKVRPWWNHYYHFHVRVTCPPGASDCEPQKPLSGDDGCGEGLTNWYAMLKKAAIAGAGPPATGTLRKSSLTMSKLPQECGTVLTAGGFEPPVPDNADPLPEPVLKALASKETGPPPPRLDAAARQALLASSSRVPLPERNPKR
jgi:penicillin-insensitive murein endopeptidase